MVDQGVCTSQIRLASTGVPHKSAITDHVTNLDHLPNWNYMNMLHKESDTIRRQISEPVWIRKSNTMNRDP